MVFHVLFDGRNQLRNVPKAAATDAFVGDLAEPPLDIPGGCLCLPVSSNAGSAPPPPGFGSVVKLGMGKNTEGVDRGWEGCYSQTIISLCLIFTLQGGAFAAGD